MPNDVIRLIVDTVPAMLAYWDADQRCVFANRAYVHWFGVEPSWLIGRTLQDLLGPIYALNRAHIEAALRGERQDFERAIPDPAGGAPRLSLATYVPHVEGQEVKGFIVLVSDITAQKSTEASLREALGQVTTLKGLLPMCAWCRKIRNDTGYWGSVEQYLVDSTGTQVTHGICETCEAELSRP